jgi:hypothetical protein
MNTLLSTLTTFAAIPGFDLVDIIIGLGIFAIIFVSFRKTRKGTPVVFSINTEIVAY